MVIHVTKVMSVKLNTDNFNFQIFNNIFYVFLQDYENIVY